MNLTTRDILILRVVSELGFASSNTIRKIVSPETKQKTFNLRLSTLKKHLFLREIQGDDRMRNQYSIFSINTSKKIIEKITTETGISLDLSSYNP